MTLDDSGASSQLTTPPAIAILLWQIDLPIATLSPVGIHALP